jgi:hypothetical protein
MSRNSLLLVPGLLLCIIVAPTLAAGTAAALSPRDASIVGGQWTWVSGSAHVPAWESYSVYGTKGVAAPGNMPGPREYSVSWTDPSGNLWLFGGYGSASGSSGRLNDLWKWDGTTWTWMSGSNGVDQHGTYGTMGVAAPGNVPGARAGSISWTDLGGDLWLFGGKGFDETTEGDLNDLWKWDGTSWTWVSGSRWVDQYGTYGTKGVAAPGNVPGGRNDSVSWTDASGSFWLFGGVGHAASGTGELNDLWRWDGTSWAWMSGSDATYQAGTYGIKGVAAPGNVPGGRLGSVSWEDASGSFWLFGGSGLSASAPGYLNDLWRWDGANWTWVSGSNEASPYGTYGTKGIAAPGNVPGARWASVPWRDASGNLWFFGGLGYGASDYGYRNDLWKWDGTNWTWMSGWDGAFDDRTYGTKGVPAPENAPRAREAAISWKDASGSLWLFGGYLGLRSSIFGFHDALNDLWRWDGTNWTWMSGSKWPNQLGTYGTKGVATPGNVPGARHGSVSWTETNGSFWLLGGWGYSSQALDGQLSDFWKWDGTSWTWVSGSDWPIGYGVYGTKGVAAPENLPGAREGSASWTDASGDFWLFGGAGNAAWASSDPSGELNDLWKWDGTNWTWVSGSDIADQPGAYGTKGVAAPGNFPGARSGSISWRDSAGNFLLFGGTLDPGVLGQAYFNDMWKWDGTTWTWLSGSDATGQPGTYGTKGVAAPGNVPGARLGATSWTDASGILWLFGGYGYASAGLGRLNDLWKWDGTNWTWVSGSNGVNEIGTYGTKGVPVPGNLPGARRSPVSWTDASGNLWLFGGAGFDTGGISGLLNDLWVFGTTCTSFAPQTTGNGGPYGIGGTITLTASTIDGATYLWTGPNGFSSTEQNPTIPNATLAMAGDYSITVIAGGCTSDAGTTTVIVIPSQTLTVTKIGSGAGSVQSSPAGIACGSTCSASFTGMLQVTLTAAADVGSRFAGWIGEACFGTDPCIVTMNGAKSVTATFLPAGGVGFHTLTPCRVVDTRNAAGPYGGPVLAAGTARAFAIAGQCGVPADAAAVALNVTVTNPTSAGHLTVFPGTGAVPGTSTISFAAGRTRANNATVALIDGLLSLFDGQATGTTDVIVDVSGYFR